MSLKDEHILYITPRTECNGCGPKGFGWLVKDRVLINMSPACNIHDCEYYWVRKFMDKKITDKKIMFYFEIFKKAGLQQIFRDLFYKKKEYADTVFLENLLSINDISHRTSPFKRKIGKTIVYIYYYAVKNFGKNFL
jgi:hypothetical protein